MSGIVQMPVALRIARHAAQVLRASGKFIREDRKDAEIAKQDAPRSLRLGELLLSIYQPRTAPTAPERAPTRVGHPERPAGAGCILASAERVPTTEQCPPVRRARLEA